MKCSRTISLLAFRLNRRNQLYGITTRKIFTLTNRKQQQSSLVNKLSAHPLTFLLHLTGITFCSISIPLIGQQTRGYSTGLTPRKKGDRDPLEEEIITSITNSNTNLIEEFSEEEVEGGVSSTLPPYNYSPQASPKQLRNLSNLLKQQLKSDTKIFDALFTLRQLHMLKEPYPYSNPQGDKWLWRLPATTAIHSIIKLANRQRKISSKESSKKPLTNLHSNLPELLSMAVKLTSNALEYDVINRRIAMESDKFTGIRDSNVGTKVFGGREYFKEIVVDTALEGNHIEDGLNSEDPRRISEAKLLEEVEDMWSEALYESLKARSTAVPHQHPHAPLILSELEQSKSSTTSNNSSKPDSTSLVPIPPPSYFQQASLSPRTLAFLAEHLTSRKIGTSYDPEIRSLSLIQNALTIPQSTRLIKYEFYKLMNRDRPDLGIQVWGEWIKAVQKRGEGSTEVKVAFSKYIKESLQVNGKAFGSAPRKKICASTAELLRILEYQWKEVTAYNNSSSDNNNNTTKELIILRGQIQIRYSPLSTLLTYLANFPVAPFVNDVPVGGNTWKGYLIHSKVYIMSTKVFRNIIQDVIGTPLYLKPLGIIIGTPPSSNPSISTSKNTHKRFPLTAHDYNTLIIYSLRHFNSPELAMLLLTKLRLAGLKPTTATFNSLLSTISSTGTEALNYIKKNPQNEQTLPTFITYLTSISDFTTLDQLVYAILPELDSQPYYLPPNTPLSELPETTKPPLDRNPYLYVTLLNALCKAGRTGLAERVFRLSRWAAELSREPDSGINGWILPPHAFTIMLQLYASEVTRGIRLERSRKERLAATFPSPTSTSPNSITTAAISKAEERLDSERSTPYVRGWGRHALRVFLLRSEQEVLREQLGPSNSVNVLRQQSRQESNDKPLPSILRREAAAIVASYELEGGSELKELDSLQSAMVARISSSAMDILFPEKLIITRNERLLNLESEKIRKEDGEDLKNKRRMPLSDVQKERRTVRMTKLRDSMWKPKLERKEIARLAKLERTEKGDLVEGMETKRLVNSIDLPETFGNKVEEESERKEQEKET